MGLRSGVLGTLGVVALYGAGCLAKVDDPGVTPSLDGGEAADADADVGSDASVPFVAIAPWKASSARIEISSSGFWQGAMRYAKDRVALTPAQLQALEGLRTRPDLGPGAEDVETFVIGIVDGDGTKARYLATQDNSSVGARSGFVGPIDKATLDPFLATFACMKSDVTTSCLAAPSGPRPMDCSPYAEVTTDPGCLNGVFVGNKCADIWITLTVPSAGTYEIATVNCIESVAIKVLSADGATVLASGDAGTKPACSAVTHTFDAPGTYQLVIEKRNAAGCDMAGKAGDFFLRVSPRP